MLIKVLGTGCAKCKKLAANVEAAALELGIDATIEKVEDLQQIMEYGVMSTPALIVGDEIKFMGKVPKVADLKKYLK